MKFIRGRSRKIDDVECLIFECWERLKKSTQRENLKKKKNQIQLQCITAIEFRKSQKIVKKSDALEVIYVAKLSIIFKKKVPKFMHWSI